MAKSNSSRIEAATRQHVGAVLTSQMITDLVKVSDPEWKGGVYPSDCAYRRTEEGLVPRGKTAYGERCPGVSGGEQFQSSADRRNRPTEACQDASSAYTGTDNDSGTSV